MTVPKRGKIYSINEGYTKKWSKGIVEYVHSRKFPETGKSAYGQRYVGSMVADVHRTLLYGGIFMYPATSDSPNGKVLDFSLLKRIFDQFMKRRINFSLL